MGHVGHRRSAGILAGVLLTLLLPAVAIGQDAPAGGTLLALAREGDFQLYEDSDTPEVIVPICITDGVDSADLTVDILDVTSTSTVSPIADRFTASVAPEGDGVAASIAVRVRAPTGIRPDTYKLSFCARQQSTATRAAGRA